jgi:predicted ATPase
MLNMVYVIAAVSFRNFKALRSARVELAPFNLLLGPNGSGKTSLIQAILQLRTLARLPLPAPASEADMRDRQPELAEITFRFNPPHDGLEATLSCVAETRCDLLELAPLPRGSGADDWAGLRARLLTARAYRLDHEAIAASAPAYPVSGDELAADGGNLGARLAALRERAPVAYAELHAELLRLFPEYSELVLRPERGEFALRLADATESSTPVAAYDLSQGTLYVLALLALAFDPAPPSIVCLEELDRGIHPRLLRDVRDILYRLAYPADYGHARPATQVIVTTHSPHLLDLFRDHPEEIILTDKVGRTATFTRLADRADLAELLSEGGSLGDLWYSGILGGVPETQ